MGVRSAAVLGMLRFIGLVNAAVWLGAGVFFTLGVGQTVFSAEMKRIFEKYYVGIIAQQLIGTYFTFHIVCGCVALAHYLGETFMTRRALRKLTLALILTPLLLGCVAVFAMQPKMRALYQTMYRAPAVEQRDAAAKRFGMLHGISQVLNLVGIACVGAVLWRVANPPEAPRFVSAHKFRG